jgi:dTDP-4-amino-4,6-dideoxygalactose transaminase
LELALIALKKTDASIYPLPKANQGDVELKPKAIIAVDLFGLPADYGRINAIANKHGLVVIEDAAQSFGARYGGHPTCGLTDTACTSFFPAKPLGGYGDGGMCFTNSDTIAEKIQSLRVHGRGANKYDNNHIGINGRLDTIQAAILLTKFEIFENEVKLRKQVAAQYRQLLAESDLILPMEPKGLESIWAQYSVLAEDQGRRRTIRDRLDEAAIPTAIYYSIPLHLQRAFAGLGYQEGHFPVSEDCSKRIFSLPMHPYLTSMQQEKIVKTIIDL